MTDSPAISESAAASYCAGRVRGLDRDRYLAALFAPADRRAALFALYAFNIEIAGVREAVSEPMLGEIRLQWWREAIDGIYAGVPRHHAVALALSEAVAEHRLPRAEFDAMIDARAFDLEDTPPATLAQLEHYAAGTSASLNRLAFRALGADGDDAARAAHHAGIAWALTGLLRAVPFHSRQRRCYLPADLMAAAGANTAMLFALKPDDALSRVARRIAGRAREHIDAARALHHAVPRKARAAVLPLVLAEAYLRRMAQNGFDPFADTGMGALSRQARLAVAAIRGRYCASRSG